MPSTFETKEIVSATDLRAPAEILGDLKFSYEKVLLILAPLTPRVSPWRVKSGTHGFSGNMVIY